MRLALEQVTEGDEDRSRWLRLAACMLVQVTVRLLTESSGRQPSYARAGWIVPNDAELDRRRSNVLNRFPPGAVALEDVNRLLTSYRGHAGYVVYELHRLGMVPSES